MSFDSITVVGLGLVGGSFAAATKRIANAPAVRAIDTDESAIEHGLAEGFVDAGALPDSPEAAAWLGPGGSDLVVLATPAREIDGWMEILGGAGFDGVVTDVASTKSAVIAASERCLRAGSFVGGHPMAGSEQSGIRAARDDLFDGAYYVLTPTQSTDMDAYRRVHSLVSALGARVISVDARSHDEAVAIISHVPHVAAAALVDVAKAHAGEGDELLRLAAGGFKDTTRIAAGSPDLWTGICLDNADAVAAGLTELAEVLSAFATDVQSRDEAAVRSWLEHTADVRRSLPAQWVPGTERLEELLIPVIDRPGVISEVTSAVGRAGCNIEAIEIDHQSEDTAVLVLVLTDEGDVDRLRADLVQRGYEPRLQPLEVPE